MENENTTSTESQQVSLGAVKEEKGKDDHKYSGLRPSCHICNTWIHLCACLRLRRRRRWRALTATRWTVGRMWFTAWAHTSPSVTAVCVLYTVGCYSVQSLWTGVCVCARVRACASVSSFLICVAVECLLQVKTGRWKKPNNRPMNTVWNKTPREGGGGGRGKEVKMEVNRMKEVKA